MSSSRPPQIVGVALIRNEDLFVERAIRNTIDFCDRLFIADHGSTDGTFAIVSRLAQEFPSKIQLVRIREPRESHFLVNGYANSLTWGFAVDGDEIYDPQRLTLFRQELLAGRYADSWQVFGNVLNCVSLDTKAGTASGYLAPPCRSMTKLFNFNAIESWDGAATHVFANGTIKFKPGFDASLRLHLHEEIPWEEASFRCLHLCFMRRSSLESETVAARRNVSENLRSGLLLSARKLLHRLCGGTLPSEWKLEKYARGALTTLDAAPFFPALAHAK